MSTAEGPVARERRPGQKSNQQQLNLSTARPELQWKRGLRELLKGRRNTRQLALPPVYAHAAHSLAAEIRKKGIRLITRMIELRGYADSTVRVAEYSIDPDSRELAEQLLAGKR